MNADRSSLHTIVQITAGVEIDTQQAIVNVHICPAYAAKFGPNETADFLQKVADQMRAGEYFSTIDTAGADHA